MVLGAMVAGSLLAGTGTLVHLGNSYALISDSKSAPLISITVATTFPRSPGVGPAVAGGPTSASGSTGDKHTTQAPAPATTAVPTATADPPAPSTSVPSAPAPSTSASPAPEQPADPTVADSTAATPPTP
jgi:hypothetical protein